MRRLTLVVLLLVLAIFSQTFAQGNRPPQTPNVDKINKRKSTPNSTPKPQIKENPGEQTSANTAATETAPIDDGDVINVETSLVSVPFKVLDRDGRFVGGLTQGDFEVYENGKKQEVAFFGTEEQPFTVVLLIDVSPSTKFKITEIQSAAIDFTKELRPSDKIIVMAFDGEVQVLSQATNDRKILEDAIKRTQFGAGTSLYEAVDVAMTRQLAKIQGRKAIVLFTDGVDTTSRKADYYSTLGDAQEQEALIYTLQYNTYEDVQKIENSGQIPGQSPVPGTGNPSPFPPTIPNPNGGITLPQIGSLPPITLPNPRDNRYPNPNDPRGRNPNPNDPRNPSPNSRNDDIFGQPQRKPPIMGGSGDTREEYELGTQYLGELSDRTGGRMYNAKSLYNVNEAFKQIAQDLRQQYSLGYYPADDRKVGQKKQIKVKVLRPKLAIQAREGYVVGKNKEAKKEKPNKFSR